MTKRERTGFEVQWCTNMPIAPDGGADVDRATYESKDFQDIDDARDFGEQIARTAVYGIAHLMRFTEDRYGHRTRGNMEELGG